jgi:precorrin-6B C5,15-methyltransferase / cobalt-precorrin-6B C5,C15-methyltransferase
MRIEGFMATAESYAHEGAAKPPWLSIVGIGEDGIDGLSTRARAAVRSAELVFGGARHLALADRLIRGTRLPWRAPFDTNLAELLAHRGRAVCVLASGDPLMYGVGALLARHVAIEETCVIPGPSAFSLAAARLFWPLTETQLLSLCGRSLEIVRPYLSPGARVLALSANSQTPAALARFLASSGFGSSKLTVLEALGGPRERIRSARAEAFDLDDIDPLNLTAIEVGAALETRILPRSAGLPDEWFEHDGQISKREIRAATLSALAPRRGELLWDVGAGSGSISIEWLLADPSLRAIAIERRADRVVNIRKNAAAFGVPHLEVIEGSAPSALEDQPAPHAIFIGGGATCAGMIERARERLRPRGRLVVNAVALQSERVLLDQQAAWGGSLMRIAISRAAPIGGEGRMIGWYPAMPVTQWTWVK